MKKFTRTLSFRRKHHAPKVPTEEQQASHWEEDSYLVKHGQIVFPVKYLGALEVTKSRGTDICHEAAMAMMKINKKKKMSLVININGVRLTDDATKQLVLDQTVEKISFCTPDPKDTRLFSYICRDGTSMKWLCHAFLSDKDSGERISNALGCAFSESYLRKEDLRKKEVANEEKNFQRSVSLRVPKKDRPDNDIKRKTEQTKVNAVKKGYDNSMAIPRQPSLRLKKDMPIPNPLTWEAQKSLNKETNGSGDVAAEKKTVVAASKSVTSTIAYEKHPAQSPLNKSPFVMPNQQNTNGHQVNGDVNGNDLFDGSVTSGYDGSSLSDGHKKDLDLMKNRHENELNAIIVQRKSLEEELRKLAQAEQILLQKHTQELQGLLMSYKKRIESNRDSQSLESEWMEIANRHGECVPTSDV